MKQLNDDASQSNDPIEEGRVRLKDLLNAGIKNSNISNVSNEATSTSEVMQNTIQAAKVAEENTKIEATQTEPSPEQNVQSESNREAQHGFEQAGTVFSESVPPEQNVQKQNQPQTQIQPQVEKPVAESAVVHSAPQPNVDVSASEAVTVGSPVQENSEFIAQQKQKVAEVSEQVTTSEEDLIDNFQTNGADSLVTEQESPSQPAKEEVLPNDESCEEVQANSSLEQGSQQEVNVELTKQEPSDVPKVESNRIQDLMNSDDDEADAVVNHKPDVEEGTEDGVIEETEEESVQASGSVYKIAGSIGVSKENGSIVVEKVEESQLPQENVEDSTLIAEEEVVAEVQELETTTEPVEVQIPPEAVQEPIEEQSLVQSTPQEVLQQPPVHEQPTVEAPKMSTQEQPPIQEPSAPDFVNSNIEEFSSNMGYKRPQDVLKDFVKFTQLQIGLMDAIKTELKGTAVCIEKGTQGLNDKFKALAESSKSQGDRIQRVANMMHSLDVNGETLSLVDSIGLINSAINDATDKILYVSKKAMSMVYALETAQENLSVTESFIGRVQKITKQTNLLSLNATIEAKRAGDAGKGFEVVADEVRALSKEISSLSEEMSCKISEVVQSVNDSFVTLNDVATVDMSDNILVKEKIDYIMESILQQSDAIEKVLVENVEFSEQTSLNISGMTMDMQFSDKASQYLNNLSNIIELIREDLSINQLDGIKSLGIEISNADIDNKTAAKIISTLSLGQLKKDFIEFLIKEKYINSSADVGQEEVSISSNSSGAGEDDDDIELF